MCDVGNRVDLHPFGIHRRLDVHILLRDRSQLRHKDLWTVLISQGVDIVKAI